MPDVDVVFRRPARDFYDNTATTTERLSFNAIIAEICDAPAADGLRRIG